MTRHGCPLARSRVLPQLVVRRLADEGTAVVLKVPFEVALFQAAISTTSTSAQPVSGIVSPRA